MQFKNHFPVCIVSLTLLGCNRLKYTKADGNNGSIMSCYIRNQIALSALELFGSDI